MTSAILLIIFELRWVLLAGIVVGGVGWVCSKTSSQNLKAEVPASLERDAT